MDSTFWDTFILLAQPKRSASSAWWIQLMTIWLPIGFLFWFLLIRPQQRERSKMKEMLTAIKKNDRVVTVGGIYGMVTNVHREADEVTIKVDEATNAKLRVTMGSIARVLADDSSDDSSSKR